MPTKTDQNAGSVQSGPPNKPKSNSHVAASPVKSNWKTEDIKLCFNDFEELSEAEVGVFSVYLKDSDNFDDSHSSTSDQGMSVRVFRTIRELYCKYRYTTLVIDLMDAGGDTSLKEQGKLRSWWTFVEKAKQVLVEDLNRRATSTPARPIHAPVIQKIPPFDAHDITAEWVLRMVSMGKTVWEDTNKANSRPPFSYVKWKRLVRSVDAWANVDTESGNQSQSQAEGNRQIINRLQQELIDRNEKVSQLEQELVNSSGKVAQLEQKLVNSKEKLSHLEQELADRNEKVSWLEQELVNSSEKVNQLEQKLVDNNKKANGLEQELVDKKKKQYDLEWLQDYVSRDNGNPLREKLWDLWREREINTEKVVELFRLSEHVGKTQQQTAHKNIAIKHDSDDEDMPLAKRRRHT